MIYKVLNTDGTACHGGSGEWSLPHDGEPGAWMPPIEGTLVACVHGYHLCRDKQVLGWLGPALYEAEYEGECLEGGDKVVVRKARLLRKLKWDERSARLFACDCAERVLHIYEEQYPNDKRPRTAIETSRHFANGEATKDELDAAWAAAWDAAGAAARAAAWAAARAAAGDAARDAARDAAWAAAGDAAGDAARAAARAAEQDWQYDRFLEATEVTT